MVKSSSHAVKIYKCKATLFAIEYPQGIAMLEMYTHSGDVVPRDPSSIKIASEVINRFFRNFSGGKMSIMRMRQ
jgi:hypothetical protein